MCPSLPSFDALWDLYEEEDNITQLQRLRKISREIKYGEYEIDESSIESRSAEPTPAKPPVGAALPAPSARGPQRWRSSRLRPHGDRRDAPFRSEGQARVPRRVGRAVLDGGGQRRTIFGGTGSASSAARCSSGKLFLRSRSGKIFSRVLALPTQ